MKKKLVLASSACLVASAMALSGCSGSSKPAETSAAAENSTETVNRLFIARIGVFVTCVFPIQQFFALASASHGNFSTLLRHIQTLSLPKISSGKCSSRTGCFLLS